MRIGSVNTLPFSRGITDLKDRVPDRIFNFQQAYAVRSKSCLELDVHIFQVDLRRTHYGWRNAGNIEFLSPKHGTRLEILEILLIDGAFQVEGSKNCEESELINALKDAVLLV